jgi:hypothetical protein
MSTTYNNIPVNSSNGNSTVQSFDAYYFKPLELDATAYIATVAFFTSKGFETPAAESIAVIILKQAKIDGYNPNKILDTLTGLNSVEISALVSEILNYNRYKTSYLGYALNYRANSEVLRNIESAQWTPTYVNDILLSEIGVSLTDENYKPIEGI